MSDRFGDTHDWPLRESASPLRPPHSDLEPEPEVQPEPEPEPEPEPDPPAQEETVFTPPPFDAEALPEVELPAVEPEPEPEPEPETPAVEHAGGELHVPSGFNVIEGEPIGGRRTVGIVISRYNGEITDLLLGSALDELDARGVSRDAVVVMPVPGAFELPLAAMALAKTRKYSCIVALGCVIRGETAHFDFVAGEAASGLQLAAIETGVPVSFGVLTCENREQAEDRVERGAEAVRSALEMADLFSQLRATAAGPL